MSKLMIVINNEAIEVTDVTDNGFGGYFIDTEAGEYQVFPDRETAGEAAREYWKDMAENDQGEFRCMVGDSVLIDWCFGNFAGPGTTKVQSLNDWLDLWLDIPEEQWASYDGEEIEGIKCNYNLLLEFELDCPVFQREDTKGDIVMYRHN